MNKLKIAALALTGILAAGSAHAETEAQYLRRMEGHPTVSKTIPGEFLGDWCYEYYIEESKSDGYVLPSWTSEECPKSKILSVQEYYLGSDEPQINCEPVRVVLSHSCAHTGCAAIARVTATCGPNNATTFFGLYRYKGHLSLSRLHSADDRYCDALAAFMTTEQMRRGECKFQEPTQ